MTKGEDYLWGQGLTTATVDNPKVDIEFKHIMSRITLELTVAPGNKNSYSFSKAYLTDWHGITVSNWVILYTNKIEWNVTTVNNSTYYGSSEISIPGIMSSDYLTADRPMSISFIMTPSYETYNSSNNRLYKSNYFWSVSFESELLTKSLDLPGVNGYEAGKNYVYKIQVTDNGDFEISDIVVTPWENTEMPDISIKEPH